MSRINVSATQVSSWRLCRRRFAFKYVAGFQEPQSPAQALGTEVEDEQLRPYLLGLRSTFDFSRPSGEIANSALAYLPPPLVPGGPRVFDLQHDLSMPSPSWRTHPMSYIGFMDLYTVSGVVPMSENGIPCVVDFKTTSDLKWARSEQDLACDVQAQLYATAAMREADARVVDLIWITMRTKGAPKAKRTHLRVVADQVAEQFASIDASAREIFEVRTSKPDPLSLPPTPSACEAFGGCPHRHRCNLSPSEFITSMSKGDVPMNAATNDWLAALKKGQPVAQPAPAAAVPTAQIPLPPAAPVALAASTPPVAPLGSTPATAWLTSAIDPMTGRAAPGINPPESKLPPIAADPLPTPASVEAKAPAKRGRPKKEQPAPAVAAPLPPVPPAAQQPTIEQAIAKPVAEPPLGVVTAVRDDGRVEVAIGGDARMPPAAMAHVAIERLSAALLTAAKAFVEALDEASK